MRETKTDPIIFELSSRIDEEVSGLQYASIYHNG